MQDKFQDKFCPEVHTALSQGEAMYPEKIIPGAATSLFQAVCSDFVGRDFVSSISVSPASNTRPMGATFVKRRKAGKWEGREEGKNCCVSLSSIPPFWLLWCPATQHNPEHYLLCTSFASRCSLTNTQGSPAKNDMVLILKLEGTPTTSSSCLSVGESGTQKS